MEIKILKKDKGSVLIEWNDGELHRGIIPEEVIIGDRVNDALISLAIPYGLDWEYVIEGLLRPVTPQIVSEALKNHGIWTLEDLRSRPSAVVGVLQQVYGVDFQTLVRAAESYVKNGGKL